MKIFYFLLILLSTGYLYPQNNIPDYSSYKSIRPRLPITAPTGVQSTILTVDGFDNFYLGNDNSEPYIAVNPNDPLNMICSYNSGTSGSPCSIYITNNGYNWARSYPGYGSFQPIGDPVMTFDSLGNMYFMEMFEQTPTGPWGGVVLKSTNKGVNWLPAVQAYQLTGGLCDKPWMTADQSAGPYSNNLYIGWRYFGPGGSMRFVRSTDKGATWSSPMSLAGDQGAYVSIGPNGNIPGGNLYYACTSNGSIILYRSTDGGASFVNTGTNIGFIGPGTICYGRYTVKNCIRTDIFPRMAADNSWTSSRGNLYIVYAANPSGPDLADIYLVKSTDYGQSWSSPVRVNDDATTTDQWMPAITVDKKTGRIFIFWYDSRNDPSGNLITELYGTTSTDGGATFVPNSKISNASFNPNLMAIGGGSDAGYMGDYIGNCGIGITSINSWMEDRVNSSQTSQSFVGYNPDFALTTNPTQTTLLNNDSTIITVKVPAIKGIYNDRVKFTYALDSLPVTGSILLSYVNGKDSLTTYPDSIYLRVKTVGNITPARNYKLTITGSGSNGTPIHKRVVSLLVNAYQITVQSNRSGVCTFKINGVSYSNPQQIIYQVGTVINVQAISPQTFGGVRYIFRNWSDNGDTTHNVTISGPIALTVYYRPQYILVLNSDYGTTVGGGQFYDSVATFTFGVYPRIVNSGGQFYRFRGWDGAGNGAYTSADSTGLDSMLTIAISNPIVETARWTLQAVGINNISSEIPDKYALHQNYPNPFNPNTNIKFDLINQGFVTLKIYDILGKEVATLVNEVLNPGFYSVSFSNNRISSGIYFYKISTDNFTEIKKMLLIK
ncbi:MAG: T9SS type A sorting domain-containing protein [Ignavibacteria bacterium]|jgi:hypothetical protein